MKKLLLIGLLIVPFALAATDTKDDLIKLDKEWGVANLKADKSELGKIYANDMFAVTPEGVLTRTQMLEGAEPADSTNYITSDYKVKMLGDDIAVMAHKGDGYRSLHVFQKQGSGWLVVATATIPDAAASASDN